jgi:MFS family permease
MSQISTSRDQGLGAEERTRPYLESPQKQRELYRRSLLVVVVSQVFGGAGLAAGIAVAALLAQEMLGTDQLAGLPAAVFALGSAAAAFLVGRLSQRLGRRAGLSAGYLVGAGGAAGVVLAAVVGSIPLLFASLLLYGSGIATNLLARYAGTDLARPEQRGTAVSVALVATTLGAVAGPNLIGAMNDLAVGLGIPGLAGPFLLAAAAYLLAAVVIFVFLRPDPYSIARRVAAQAPAEVPVVVTATRKSARPPARHGVFIGATVMVLTQLAMVAIMTMTPLQMREHGHGLGDVGIVISVHIGAMFLPSLVTGVLVDRVGRIPIALASGVILLVAGVVASVAPAGSMTALLLALALLGLGWNFGLISGTAMIIDAAPPATRAKTQGAVDVLIALSGAAGGAASGMVVAGSSYAALSVGGGILAVLLVPVVLWGRGMPKQTTRP